MRVLIFNHAFFHISETFVYQQVKGMPDDMDVELLGFKIENEDLFPLKNKKYKVERAVNAIDKMLSRILRLHYKFSVFNTVAVKNILSKGRYDLVHAHFGFNALMIFPLVKLMNIPLVITFHGVDASSQMLKDERYKRSLQKMLAYASGIIVVSPHMKATLGLDKYDDKVHVIPCGVDADEFNVGVPLTEKNTITILHSGRMVSKKGVPDLVKVFAALSHQYENIRLLVIGEGPDLELSKQMSSDAREGSVIFLGAKPHAEVKRYMAEADIFVLNSRVGDKGDMEGVPVSLLEAMSLRRAVVTTRHAGIPYVVTDDADGLLVDERDDKSLSAAIERLINDTTLRKRLGEAARQTVVGRFTSLQTNQKISEVYRSVVKKNISD